MNFNKEDKKDLMYSDEDKIWKDLQEQIDKNQEYFVEEEADDIKIFDTLESITNDINFLEKGRHNRTIYKERFKGDRKEKLLYKQMYLNYSSPNKFTLCRYNKYEYDSKGKIIREEDFWYGLMEIYEYEYDNKGKLINKKVYENDKLLYEIKHKYKYDNKGRLLNEKIYYCGELIKETNELKCEFIHGIALQDEIKYKYDNKGRLVNKKKYKYTNSRFIDDKDVIELVYEDINRYDNKNRLVKQEFRGLDSGYKIYKYNNKGKLINQKGYFCNVFYDIPNFEKKYKYDDKGILVNQQHYFYNKLFFEKKLIGKKLLYNKKKIIIKKEYKKSKLLRETVFEVTQDGGLRTRRSVYTFKFQKKGENKL